MDDVIEEAVTVTSTVPRPGGAMAVMVVGDSTVKRVAGVDPKRTEVTSTKFVPEMVTVFPPESGPEAGERFVTAGPKKFVEA